MDEICEDLAIEKGQVPRLPSFETQSKLLGDLKKSMRDSMKTRRSASAESSRSRHTSKKSISEQLRLKGREMKNVQAILKDVVDKTKAVKLQYSKEIASLKQELEIKALIKDNPQSAPSFNDLDSMAPLPPLTLADPNFQEPAHFSQFSPKNFFNTFLSISSFLIFS